LGQGIIPDLEKVGSPKGVPNYPLNRSEAAIALKVAEAARDVAVKALKGRHFQPAAKAITHLLQGALEVVLA
jgi:hypothetical protein